jgi:hypothetical protein
MVEANSSLGRQHGFTAPESRASAAPYNVGDGSFDANMFRPPDHYVFIYTVSDREFIVCQPPLFPKLIVRPKVVGERCSLVLRLPSPFQQEDREGAVGDIIVRAYPGERVAASLCNPNNPTLNQDAVVSPTMILGLGVDLNCQGVFWSINNPPTEKEIVAAEARREKYYRTLLERARTLEISNPKELEYLINQDYHMAAEYFNEEHSWHKKLVRLTECPNCGDSIKPGIAFHRSSAGVLCILDKVRAAKAGVTADTPVAP